MKKIFVLIILAIGLMLSCSGLAYATDLSTNLVTDGDGAGDGTGNISPSWTKVTDSGYEDHWTVVTVGGTAGYAPISPYDTADGTNEFYDYWYDTTAVKSGQIYQDISLVDTAGLFSKIDAGNIGLNAEAYIYEYFTDDTGLLEIQFFDGSNAQISVGPYQSSISASGGSWTLSENKHIAVPATTRKIRVILTALLINNTSYVDFDGIDVQLCNLPTISITDQTANHTYKDYDTITISGTASDPDSAALTISAAIDGHTATASIPSGSGAWSLSWDIAGLPINAGDYSNIAITADNGQGIRTGTYTGTLTVTAPHKTAAAAAAAAGPGVGADNTITITVKDSAGNADTDFDGSKTVTITGYAAAPDATYGSFGVTALEADGSTDVPVSFTDGVGTASLKLNKAAAQTIGLSVAGVDTPATNNLNITPVHGAAAAMEVTQDITAPLANGENFAQQPKVALKDQYGNICTGNNTTVVTVSKKDAGAWTLTGTLTATASSGVATFSGLGATNTVAVAGAQLAFDSGGLPQATSSAVNLPAAASSHHNGGGGSQSNQPSNSLIPSSQINTNADKSVSDSLSASGEATVVLGTATIGDKAQLTPVVVETLSKNDKSLTVERSGVEIKFAPDSLMTVEMNAALADTTARVEIGVREVSAQEKAQILTQSKIGESTGLFEVGGKIVDLSAQITQTVSNQQVSAEKIKNFSEPVAVTIDLSGLTLSKEEIASLTGVRYEKAVDGSINAVKLGGSYDSASKTFTFYTDRFSLYGVLTAKEIKRISLKLGDKTLYVNGEQKTMDVIPEVVNNRTLVPIRFIAEAMGAEVTWDNASSTAGIFLKEKKIHITIGEKLPEMDTPPIIKNNRTFVPLRFVAETLGAQVLWFNSTQNIQITQ